MGWRPFSGMGHLLKQENVLLMGTWVLHAVEKLCDEVKLSINPDKTGLVVLTRIKKIPAFFHNTNFGFFTSLYVCQLSRNNPEFSADLEGACGYQGKEGSQLAAGLWCDVSAESQGVPFSHSTIHHFCFLSLVV